MYYLSNDGIISGVSYAIQEMKYVYRINYIDGSHLTIGLPPKSKMMILEREGQLARCTYMPTFLELWNQYKEIWLSRNTANKSAAV